MSPSNGECVDREVIPNYDHSEDQSSSNYHITQRPIYP